MVYFFFKNLNDVFIVDLIKYFYVNDNLSLIKKCWTKLLRWVYLD